MTGRVLVTGAGGNVGRAVLEELTARGAIVRAADRTPVEGAAEFARLDFGDERTFAPAVDGCTAMFLLRPPAIGDRPGRSDARSLDRRRGRCWGRASHLPVGRRVAFIDARDIGEVAAIALTDPAVHAGHAYHLTGPEAVTFDEVARLLAERLGRPVRYEPATVPGYLRHLRRRGLPLAQIIVQTILHVGLRRGDAAEVDPTIERLLGRPPRTIAQFVADRFAPGL